MDAPKQSFMDILYPSSRAVPNIQLDADDDNGETDGEDFSKYTDNSYPAVLTNFKIGARLNMKEKFKSDKFDKRLDLQQQEVPKSFSKREISQKMHSNRISDTITADRKFSSITRDKIDKLKDALNQLQHPSSLENVEAVEENLKGILEDMGLIDDKTDDSTSDIKQHNQGNVQETEETVNEDEDLESGLNKIQLTRETHETNKVERVNGDKNEGKLELNAMETNAKNTKLTEERNVKEGISDLAELNTANLDALKEENNEEMNSSPKQQIHEDSNDENTENKRDVPKINIANYQVEGEAFIRKKRQQKIAKVSSSGVTESSELMKGLEKSGDLTVSGNKSPLASASEIAETKRKTEKSTVSENSSNETSDEEQRIEREIQAKIDAIKEEVKREIAMLNAQEQNTSQLAGPERKKRGVGNLLDEESPDLDPQSNIDEIQVPHIRKRRSPPPASNSEHLNEDNDSSVDGGRGAANEGIADVNSLTVANRDANENDSDLKSDTKNNAELDSKSLSPRSAAAADIKEDAKLKAALTGSVSMFGDNDRSRENVLSNRNKLKDASIEASERDAKILPEANKLQPLINHEDASKRNRRRRQAYDLQRTFEYNRRKRANTGNSVAFVPYREDEEEVDDEGDESDDDNFGDRTSELVHSRRYDPSFYYNKEAAVDDQEYDTLDDAPSYNLRNTNNKVHHNLMYSYAANLNNKDEDENLVNPGQYMYDGEPAYVIRKKRHDFADRIALHSGGPTLNRIAATRERNAKIKDNSRKKRNYRKAESEAGDDNQPQQIADMSDTDLFGPLPQSYEGELSRFKRVKRKDTN